MDKRLIQRAKNIYHYAVAQGWRWYFGRPDHKLKIYGITGTNGKTTTSHILASILAAEYGAEKVGMLTTIEFRVGAEREVNKTKMTTLDSRLVFAYLHRMALAGVERVVLEITSHALDQYRLAGIRLDGAIFLNIAREHLDYHETMEEYLRAKVRIADYLKEGARLVINERILNQFKKFPPWAGPRCGGANFKLVTFSREEARKVETPLAGKWNKENVLVASMLARAIGINNGAIRRGVAAVKQVPGRMETIEIQNPKSKIQIPKVIIDYAVTPDALANLYQEVRKDTMGKIFAVLGAAGLRDRGKRPLMARAVAQYADEIVLTREDPWTEDEEQIFADLEGGLKSNPKSKIQMTNQIQNPNDLRGVIDEDRNCSWRRIVDRREAIKYCLENAGAGDAVIVTGKGAEEGMAVGEKIIPWNDKKVILELLEEIEE